MLDKVKIGSEYNCSASQKSYNCSVFETGYDHSATKSGFWGGKWSARDLVMLGVFAAAAKLSSLAVTLLGGGLNPVTFIAKNTIFTAILVVLICKLRRPGSFVLFASVSTIVTVMVLGGAPTLIVSMLLGGLVAEILVLLAGGINRPIAPYIGVAAYDFFSKVFSLFFSYLTLRESVAMFFMAIGIVGIGYIGSLIGLLVGYKAVKELKNASIITE